MLKKVVAGSLAFILIILNFSGSMKANTKIDGILGNMSLREKIGQMMMPDFRRWNMGSGEEAVTEINDEIAQIVADYKFGGVIFFADNLPTNENATRLTHQFQKVALENNMISLFTSVDQEGGKVTRLGQGTSLPGNMALGASGVNENAFKAATIIANEVDALGLNVNFGPTLDVNNNPNNPVIGERSFSSNPQIVADLGVEYINGLETNNVSASVKHFPGHGDTATDSHSGLPVVDKSYEELKGLELVPFQKAIDNGVDMIMTAHISYPQIEKETFTLQSGELATIPATLSKVFLTDILRNDMGYDGIIVTDALNMQAISDNFGEPDAAVKVIQAGGDIALMPVILRSTADVQKIEDVYVAIEQAIASGTLTEERIDESVRRILEVKERRGILDYANDTRTLDEKIANAETVVGSKEHRATERVITQQAITVGVNKEFTLPLRPKATEKVVILTPYNNEVPAWQFGMDRLFAEGVVPNDTELEVIRFTSGTTEEEFAAYIANANYVIAVSEISSPGVLPTSWLASQPETIIRKAHEVDAEAVVVSIGKPYDLVRYPEADAIVLAYGAKGMDPTEAGTDPIKTYGPNIPTSLDVVFGKVEATGTLPVEIPALDETNTVTEEIAYEVGHGIKNLQVVGAITQAADKTVLDLGEEVMVKASLDGYGTLLDKEFTLVWTYDENVFEKVSQDADTITLRAKSKGNTTVSTTEFVDAKERIFTPEVTAETELTVISSTEISNKVNDIFGEDGKVKEDITKEQVAELLAEVEGMPESDQKQALLDKLYAAAKTIEIRETPFKGLPDVVKVGDTFTLYPANDTETGKKGWSFDKKFFKATFNSPATFTALKDGTTTITYTDADGDLQSATMTIAPKDSPISEDTTGKDVVLPTTGENIAVSIVAGGALMVVSLLLVLRTYYRKIK